MKVSHELYVHVAKHDDKKYACFNFDASSNGYVLVNRQAVTLDIPDDFDPTATKIDMLQKEIKRAEEEFSERVTKLKEEISKLTALTFEVPA
jgi:hypothetical protein